MQLSLEEEAVCRLRMGQDTHVWAAEATSEWSNPPFLLPRALLGQLPVGVLQGCLIPAGAGVK